MSQECIEQTLQTILDQLHGTENKANSMKKLTAAEIAQILARQSDEKPQKEHQDTKAGSEAGLFQIDMESFDLEMQGVNSHWQLLYYRPINCYRKLVAKLIIFGKRVVRRLLKFLIEPLVEEQAQFNSATVKVLNSMRNHHVVFQAAIDYLCNEVSRNKVSQDALSQEIQTKLGQLNEIRNQVHVLVHEENEIRDQVHALVRKENENNVYDVIDYFKFQEQMRGSFTEIKKRQFSYLTYFEGCKSVIDLGCGRGEFVELLKEHEIEATGVDLYTKSVQFCRSRGLNVVEQDAVSFLKAQKEESADGIFSAQLVEHISAGQILEICRESYRVLKPGCYLVIETPNPMCLSTYMNSFYLDPSHKNPVHPHLMEYFLQECGYSNVKITFTQASKSGYRLPLLNMENCKNLAEFNDGVNFLSDIIFGSEEYAIIAQK